jgi:hypothetical protein
VLADEEGVAAEADDVPPELLAPAEEAEEVEDVDEVGEVVEVAEPAEERAVVADVESSFTAVTVDPVVVAEADR